MFFPESERQILITNKQIFVNICMYLFVMLKYKQTMYDVEKFSQVKYEEYSKTTATHKGTET